MPEPAYKFGIRANLHQFTHQLIQVFFVGLTIGMMRTVIPALAEKEFGVPAGSFLLLVSFVVSFGFVKGALNFIGGRLSEFYGRKRILILGWIAAIPIPFMIKTAPDWNWIVAATLLLGINQGLTWSMTQTAKLDLTRPEERGVTIGLNELGGYGGVAVAGVATAVLAETLGPRDGLFYFGLLIVSLSLFQAIFPVQETLPWALAEAEEHKTNPASNLNPDYLSTGNDNVSTFSIFKLLSFGNRRFFAFNQAGLVEKFVDALVWIFYPVFLFHEGATLSTIGWIVGIYGVVWGLSQFFTGRLSDRVGRRPVILAGMWICAAGVAFTPLVHSVLLWSVTSAITGIGMALLYPNLSAAIADISHPVWRGSAIGVYRFWRDLGYGFGALLLGIAADAGKGVEYGFYFTSIAMFLSGLIVWKMGEETLPKFNSRRGSPGP